MEGIEGGSEYWERVPGSDLATEWAASRQDDRREAIVDDQTFVALWTLLSQA
jgi:hypothetical protein